MPDRGSFDQTCHKLSAFPAISLLIWQQLSTTRDLKGKRFHLVTIGVLLLRRNGKVGRSRLEAATISPVHFCVPGRYLSIRVDSPQHDTDSRTYRHCEPTKGKQLA
jgi:hypothetical protein